MAAERLGRPWARAILSASTESSSSSSSSMSFNSSGQRRLRDDIRSVAPKVEQLQQVITFLELETNHVQEEISGIAALNLYWAGPTGSGLETC